MLAFPLLAAFLVGTLMPIQAAINARLGQTLQHSLLAAFLSFLGGTIALGFFVLAQNPGAARWREAVALPWWAWSGGILGACFVSAALMLVPKIGALGMMAGFITGQLFMSVLMDHQGWFNLAVRPLDGWRVAGIILLGLGLWALTRTSNAA